MVVSIILCWFVLHIDAVYIRIPMIISWLFKVIAVTPIIVDIINKSVVLIVFIIFILSVGVPVVGWYPTKIVIVAYNTVCSSVVL